MSGNTKSPWHLWVVGTVATLFNGVGALDYVMTQTNNEEYLKGAGLNQEQIDFFANFPAWADALWAIGVWGGVLGGILLLLRKSRAVQVLLFSFIGGTASMSNMYIFSNGREVVGDHAAFAVVIVVLAYGFFHYARLMKKKGILD